MNSIVEILIDFSTSMKGDRIAATKKILSEEILPNLDYSGMIAIKLFFSGANNTDEVIALMPLQKTSSLSARFTVENQIGEPNGNTPIAFAIEESIKALKGYENSNRKIILLTDGEENRGGDYKLAAENARNLHGIPCEFHIIGLDQKPEHEKKAREIAAITSGKYVNFSTADYSKTRAERDLKDFKIGIKYTPPIKPTIKSSPSTTHLTTTTSNISRRTANQVTASIPQPKATNNRPSQARTNIKASTPPAKDIKPKPPRIDTIVDTKGQVASPSLDTKSYNPATGELSSEVNLRMISDFLDDHFNKHQNIENIQPELSTYDEVAGYVTDINEIDLRPIMVIPILGGENGYICLNEVIFQVRSLKGDECPVERLIVVLDEWNRSEEIYFKRQSEFFKSSGGKGIHVKICGFPGNREI